MEGGGPGRQVEEGHGWRSAVCESMESEEVKDDQGGEGY